ncbi:hypothetical protein BCAR13_170025 [Paraburkholderia caribensis]|nr:hypothetical protein BCAR13_170025 [Paraburkholderia caribensis]
MRGFLFFGYPLCGCPVHNLLLFRRAQQSTPFGQLFLGGLNAYAVRFPNRTVVAALAAPAAQYDGERR